jgi:hypothetical protein
MPPSFHFFLRPKLTPLKNNFQSNPILVLNQRATTRPKSPPESCQEMMRYDSPSDVQNISCRKVSRLIPRLLEPVQMRESFFLGQTFLFLLGKIICPGY